MPPSPPALLGPSWDASKQQTYRQQHGQECLTYHFVLDESPSMAGEDAVNLRTAFNMYLGWLQQHAHPMSQAEVRLFSTALSPANLVPLGEVQPLTRQTYDPLRGDGTALFRAIGDTCTLATSKGQHMLVVFTDGRDNTSDQFAWTSQKVATLLETLQAERDWLCVFLGAFPDALPVAKVMGFTEGNCLVFPNDQIPEAFQSLTRATMTYLAATPPERKLLAAGGVF